MKTLEIDRLETGSSGGVAELSAFLRFGAHSRQIFFRTAHGPVATSGDPFVPAVVLPAMAGKFDIDLRFAISDEMVLAASRIQEMESAWHPAWRIAKLNPSGNADLRRPSTGAVGAFFSGGVDSFYTLQKHRDEITHLIFVSGFDVPLHRSALRQLITRELRKTAEEVGLPLIEVETNLREFSNGLQFSWEEQHGAALAAVAHFLAPSFDKVYLPSSYALPFLLPYGSHPGLDPLWSSKSLTLVHDGIEATRFDKIGALRAWDTAVRSLRVCWQLVEGQYNCCQCRKCLWTMAFLRAHGILERATSFPRPLDLEKLSEQGADATEHRYRLLQAIAMVEARGNDPALVVALRNALKPKNSLRRSLRRWVKRLKLVVYHRLRLIWRTCRGFFRA
jgi:hypothetical protein